jgi:hypothetical protein
VRLSPENAAQLFALVKDEGVANTTVVLTGDVQVAWARRANRLAATRGGAVGPAPLARPADDDVQVPRGYGRFYGETAPRYGEFYPAPPPVEYGRSYGSCPPPPPGFPTPACAYARPQANADVYPPRRYPFGGY